MSGRLIGDLIEWRRTPPGAELSSEEFLVLVAIADRVLDENARMMRKFKGDEGELHDRICQVVGVEKRSLKKILSRLAERGLEVRVMLKKDSKGNPVYAFPGNPMQFQFPELPAIVWLPLRSEACG